MIIARSQIRNITVLFPAFLSYEIINHVIYIPTDHEDHVSCVSLLAHNLRRARHEHDYDQLCRTCHGISHHESI